MNTLSRTLVVAGLVLVVLGLLVSLVPSLPLLGKLPGDIRIERPGVRIYVPLASCLLVSVAVSAFLWLLARLR